MPGPGLDANPEPDSGPGGDERPGRVRPRPNIVSGDRPGFRKRYEAVGYWILLAIVLALVIWFLASTAIDLGNASGAGPLAIAPLFAPGTMC